ncbi:hypothetical protein [Treponema sp. R80B11-R83G3]
MSSNDIANIDKYGKLVYYKLMGIKKAFLMMSLTVIIVLSCGSGPEKQKPDTGGSSNNSTNSSSLNKNEPFDPSKISQEQYLATRAEVQKFIEEQNKNIKSKNFEAWKKSLSPEYFAEISSAENLRQMSELPAMKSRKIVLKTVQDYFDNVVVPSRADLHVDAIEFISANRVKAFTIMTNKAGEEQKLRLYDLEKIDNSWTIIN